MGKAVLRASSMKLSKSQGCVLVFVVFMIVLSLACWWTNSVINASYQKFREDDWIARQKLGELNAKVFDKLPPAPDGAIQTEFFNNGGAGNSYYHGNYLLAEYKLDVPPETVIEYYKAFFEAQKWEQRLYNEETLNTLFFHETSCVRIEPIYTEHFHGFSIWIWHDYEKQSFSPEFPPFLEISEVGEMYVDKCPR